MVPLPLGSSITGMLWAAPLVTCPLYIWAPFTVCTREIWLPVSVLTVYGMSAVTVPRLPSCPEMTRADAAATCTAALVV